MVQQSVLATTSTINTIQGQQYSTSPSSTQKKPPSACWNCAGRHFTGKCPFKTHRCCECNQQGFCTPPVHKTTNKRPHNKRRLKRKKHTNSLVATFLPNSKSNRKYVSEKLNSSSVRLKIDTASDITLISQRLWKTIGQPPLQYM